MFISKSFIIKIIRYYIVKEYIVMLGMEKYIDMFFFVFVRNFFSCFIFLYNYVCLEELYYYFFINLEKVIYGKYMDYDIFKDVSIEEVVNLLLEGKLVYNLLYN